MASSLTIMSAEFRAEEVLGASTWVKVSAAHSRTGCTNPREHDGFSRPSAEHSWALRNGLCNEQVLSWGYPMAGRQSAPAGKRWALSRKNILDRGECSIQPCSSPGVL